MVPFAYYNNIIIQLACWTDRHCCGSGLVKHCDGLVYEIRLYYICSHWLNSIVKFVFNEILIVRFKAG